MTQRSETIRILNDAFRQTMRGGKVLLTRGVHTLPLDKQRVILQRVCGFDDFNEGNDPNGEHDFGAIDLDGVRYFFKIDYYAGNDDMDHGSEDPADPSKTTRVLTIMRADEY